MTKHEYNGWTNYETWAWKLWMDNDQGTQEYWHEITGQIIQQSPTKDAAIYSLMNTLKEDCDENSPLVDASPYSDLLSAAISEINFYEIAENMISDYEEYNV